MTQENTQENVTFESAIRELEETVKKLENGGLSLDDAISYYTKGKELKVICEKKLEEAKLKIEKIIESADGETSTEPYAEQS